MEIDALRRLELWAMWALRGGWFMVLGGWPCRTGRSFRQTSGGRGERCPPRAPVWSSPRAVDMPCSSLSAAIDLDLTATTIRPLLRLFPPRRAG